MSVSAYQVKCMAIFGPSIEWQLIEVVNEFQRIERQLLQIHRRIGQSQGSRSRIRTAGVSRPVGGLPVRIFLLPQLVPHPHSLERLIHVEPSDDDRIVFTMIVVKVINGCDNRFVHYYLAENWPTSPSPGSIEAVAQTHAVDLGDFTLGKVNIEFRGNGPVADMKPVSNPKPPQELVFVFFRFYRRCCYEAQPFIRVYEQRNPNNPFSEILTDILQKTSDSKVLIETVLLIQPYSERVLMLLVGISQEKPNLVTMIVRFQLAYIPLTR